MAVVPEANELGTEAKRGLRAGVQAESLSRTLVLAFRFRQKRGEVLAGMVDKLLVDGSAEDRRKEARECQKMEQEDSNSQDRRRWEKISGPRSPVPSSFRITSDSFDVRTATLTSSMTGTASPQTTTH